MLDSSRPVPSASPQPCTDEYSRKGARLLSLSAHFVELYFQTVSLWAGKITVQQLHRAVIMDGGGVVGVYSGNEEFHGCIKQKSANFQQMIEYMCVFEQYSQ